MYINYCLLYPNYSVISPPQDLLAVPPMPHPAADDAPVLDLNSSAPSLRPAVGLHTRGTCYGRTPCRNQVRSQMRCVFAVMGCCDLGIGVFVLCASFKRLVWLVRMEVFVLLFFVDGSG